MNISREIEYFVESHACKVCVCVILQSSHVTAVCSDTSVAGTAGFRCPHEGCTSLTEGEHNPKHNLKRFISPARYLVPGMSQECENLPRVCFTQTQTHGTRKKRIGSNGIVSIRQVPGSSQ